MSCSFDWVEIDLHQRERTDKAGTSAWGCLGPNFFCLPSLCCLIIISINIIGADKLGLRKLLWNCISILDLKQAVLRERHQEKAWNSIIPDVVNKSKKTSYLLRWFAFRDRYYSKESFGQSPNQDYEKFGDYLEKIHSEKFIISRSLFITTDTLTKGHFCLQPPHSTHLTSTVYFLKIIGRIVG